MQVELAAIVDWGEPFVKATYKLEGDGALALQCYKVIDTIRASIHAANTPNLLAVAERLSSGVHEMQPSASSLESLKVFPFFDSQEELETLKAELPAYLAKAADVDSSIDPLQWWQKISRTKDYYSHATLASASQHVATLSRSAPVPSTATTSPSPGTALFMRV